MLLSHFEWLCIILPTLIAATPQNTVRSPSEYPLQAKLQQEVPACAQPCLRASLSGQFPLACTVPADLECLCSRYGLDGETLGELALGCIYASCSTVDRSAASAYNVCLGQKGAVRPTLSVLTVPARTSATSTHTMSSGPVVTTKPSSTISSVRTTQSHSNSVAVDSVSTIPTPTSASSQVATAIAAADPPQTMKPAQIAGLSVAAAAAFIIAIGLMALSVFLRRRRERKNVTEINEKRGFTPSPRNYSSRFSQPFYPDSSSLGSPKRFPMPPAAVQRKPSDNLPGTLASNGRVRSPFNTSDGLGFSPRGEPKLDKVTDLSSIHPLLRPGAGISKNSSDSSVPLDQIGLAISAELPGSSTVSSVSAPLKTVAKEQRPKSLRQQQRRSLRPDSGFTDDTVFEEDDVRYSRRESRLLPTPPIPIPPIRSFQPSRPPPKFSLDKPPQGAPKRRLLQQQPELFLDIPVRHSRSQPMRMAPIALPSHSSTPAKSSQPVQKAPQAPLPQVLSKNNLTSTTNSREPSNGWDIPDYYFTAHHDSTTKYFTPSSSPGHIQRPKESPKLIDIKPKHSASTLSRATSRASTNIRDSVSSQTSFETADPNDSTPEDEDDKQLDGNKLSPVAESPISNLRYPRVPRASNQLVPRSPRSPQSQQSQDSPRRLPEPSSLLVKRRGEEGAHQLQSPIQLGSPSRSEVANHFRKYRQHLRSTSLETWSTVRNSERSTRTQSGLWPKSPAMYEPDVVQPLRIRSKQLSSPVEMQDLKSPLWVPRLTPRREGDDLLISVTYSQSAYSQPGH